jgi:HemY protein
MLWSLLKIVLFIAVAAALAYGASILLETPGEVVIAIGQREFSVTPLGFVLWLLGFVVLAVVVLKVLGFLWALVRFVLGDETAISRFFARNREKRGLDALSGSMIALASGEASLASRRAAKAERLLNRPEITRLVRAQAAELNDDREKALDIYKSMLANDRTRFVAVDGLTRLKLEAGETDTALALAKKGFALQPGNARMLRTLFDLQSKTEDWSGARGTLNATMHARLLPRDVGTRRDAILSLADARKAQAEGRLDRSHEAAKQANKLAPNLVPAATMAAEAYAAEGSVRKASKILRSAWGVNPHPDLAAAYAALAPSETPSARRRRFDALIAANPNHAESRLLGAELALADEDFPGARKALGDLAETDPTTRSLAVMAAIERGQGAPEAVVRGWLAKAINASRGPQWICDRCNHVHSTWGPVCDNCSAFDTLEWKTAPNAEGAGLAQSTMLPLIIGGGGAPESQAPVGPVVEDAEIATERTA